MSDENYEHEDIDDDAAGRNRDAVIAGRLLEFLKTDGEPGTPMSPPDAGDIKNTSSVTSWESSLMPPPMTARERVAVEQRLEEITLYPGPRAEFFRELRHLVTVERIVSQAAERSAKVYEAAPVEDSVIAQVARDGFHGLTDRQLAAFAMRESSFDRLILALPEPGDDDPAWVKEALARDDDGDDWNPEPGSCSDEVGLPSELPGSTSRVTKTAGPVFRGGGGSLTGGGFSMPLRKKPAPITAVALDQRAIPGSVRPRVQLSPVLPFQWQTPPADQTRPLDFSLTATWQESGAVELGVTGPMLARGTGVRLSFEWRDAAGLMVSRQFTDDDFISAVVVEAPPNPPTGTVRVQYTSPDGQARFDVLFRWPETGNAATAIPPDHGAEIP